MAHFGLSYDEIVWGQPWGFYQRAMLDAPGYDPDYEEDQGLGGVKELTPENGDDFMKYLLANGAQPG